MATKSYFRSESPQAMNAPGGVLRWLLFVEPGADHPVGVLETSSPAQAKFLQDRIQNGSPIRELTEAEYQVELGKSKGRSVLRDREALTPSGVRGGGVPTVAEPAAASPVGTSPEPAPTQSPAVASVKAPEPVLKRRDVRRVQDGGSE